MKNRRIAIVSFLLIAVLVMGIGFAALTDNLFIKGEAQLETSISQPLFDSKVYFVAESADASLKSELVGTTGTASVPAGLTEGVKIGETDPDSATFYLYSLGKTDEHAIFSFVIRNDSTENHAKINVDTDYPHTSNTEMFKFEYSVDKTNWVDATNSDTAEITCNAGGYAQVFVKVTLKRSPVENTTAAFNVNLTATAVPVA